MNKDRLIILAARAIGMIGNEWVKTPEQVWEWLNNDEEFEVYDDTLDLTVVETRYDENIEFIKSKL